MSRTRRRGTRNVHHHISYNTNTREWRLTSLQIFHETQRRIFRAGCCGWRLTWRLFNHNLSSRVHANPTIKCHTLQWLARYFVYAKELQKISNLCNPQPLTPPPPDDQTAPAAKTRRVGKQPASSSTGPLARLHRRAPAPGPFFLRVSKLRERSKKTQLHSKDWTALCRCAKLGQHDVVCVRCGLPTHMMMSLLSQSRGQRHVGHQQRVVSSRKGVTLPTEHQQHTPTAQSWHDVRSSKTLQSLPVAAFPHAQRTRALSHEHVCASMIQSSLFVQLAYLLSLPAPAAQSTGLPRNPPSSRPPFASLLRFQP